MNFFYYEMDILLIKISLLVLIAEGYCGLADKVRKLGNVDSDKTYRKSVAD